MAETIEGIVQHQTLLERKLSDQLQDLARRRAEIDELERSAVEDMLKNDKQHRISAGSGMEDFLVNCKQASRTYISEKNSIQDNQEIEPKSIEDAETSDESTLST